MARLFIGIKLPPGYQDRVLPLTQELDKTLRARVNWTRPGNWHLTLKFLGDTEAARIPSVIDALASIERPAFTMQAGGAGAFPNPRQPRVIWLGLDRGAEQCEDLAAAVNDALASVDIPREKKQFRPHLTLGRIKKPGKEDWQTVLDLAAREAWPTFTVDRFTLWQSELKPTGAVHTAIAQFNLKE